MEDRSLFCAMIEERCHSEIDEEGLRTRFFLSLRDVAEIAFERFGKNC
jgi:hypothetical protein